MKTTPNTTTSSARAGDDLRLRVESLGSSLAERLGEVVSAVPGRPTGPQALGSALGQTTVTASRLLKALSQVDPVAVLQLLPGPNPLRKIVDAARDAGTDPAICDAAKTQIAAFDELIRSEAGDRGALKAMLSAWLPDDRREFEAQRRQTVFKAMSELEGVSCELEVTSMLLAPASQSSAGPSPEPVTDGSTAGQSVDIVTLECLLGIDRIRPDAVVKLGTRRISRGGDTEALRRVPRNLDGEPALNGLHTVRLDAFCTARPGPFEAREIGPHVQYSLGPTGFGRDSQVDVVIAEVNRSERLPLTPSEEAPPYFFTIPEMATRKAVFDLIVHEDVFPGSTPEVCYHSTAALGPVMIGDPSRSADGRWFPESLLSLGNGTRGVRLLEFPRYTALLEHAAEKLALNLTQFRVYRVAVNYPLVGNQITMAFRRGAV